MEVMEQLCIPEPKWILDRKDSGQLYWRRDASSPESDCRVKFRCDVEVREFSRQEHEFSSTYYNDGPANPYLEHITMGFTCMLCLAVTVLLPWYMIT